MSISALNVSSNSSQWITWDAEHFDLSTTELACLLVLVTLVCIIHAGITQRTTE